MCININFSFFLANKSGWKTMTVIIFRLQMNNIKSALVLNAKFNHFIMFGFENLIIPSAMDRRGRGGLFK